MDTCIKREKVLVVHPFVDTIESQYARRELLFEDTNILPSFELKTLRAVQSNAGNDVIFVIGLRHLLIWKMKSAE